uniref:Replication initiator protein n=1 Tax=Dulem virus 148 TaxID=3145625 RepID=A0AAU8B6H5_9VIRU
MSCYHPQNAVVLGVDPSTGKKALRFLGSDVTGFLRYPGKEIIQVPCGQCIGCRIDRSRQWANRCMLELQYHDSAYFVTLTYDDFHVPKSYYPDPETGEAHTSYTLCKRDFQLWMKRLRKKFSDDKIRFFACGEYGGSTKRPHYHAILFGLHLNDLEKYKTVREGDSYYTYYNSPSLQETWSYGFVVVGEVTWESCAYVARYVTKKFSGEQAEFYEKFGLVPEFSDMSRRPGIARQYYDDHGKAIYDHAYINISTPKGGKKFKPPRYFDRLFDIDCPGFLDDIKDQRKCNAQAVMDGKMKRTNLTPPEILKVEEAAFENKTKKLKRGAV